MAVIDNYGPNEQAIIELFSAVLNKAPTPDLIAGGAAALADGATPGQILDLLFNYPDVPYTAYKAGAPTNAFVTALVNHLTAGSDISAETKAAWVALLAPEVASFSSRGEFAATVVALVNGGEWEEGSDLAALQAHLAAKAEAAAESSYDSTATYTGWDNLEGVTGGGENPTGSSILTYGTDYLSGHNEYTAPVVQNPTLGNVTNTLETGDTILGQAGGGGVLKADLVLTTQGGIPIGPAISSITNNIDKIILRAQTTNSDILTGVHGNLSHIDAERNVGVKEWWTQDSRSTIQIEDVRTLPEDTLIGVRNTDPEVGFRVYFDPAQLLDRVSSQSIITLNLGDVDRPGSLEFVPIDGVGFYLDGEPIVLRSEAIGAATTYEAFVAALNAAVAATPAAAGLVITLNPDNSISVQDPNGGTFTKGGWQFINDSVPADGNLFYNQEVGNPSLSTEPVTTSLVLDAVGRTSAGGVVDIGSLGNGGVERFNVEVQRDSWVAALQSSEHLGNVDWQNNLPPQHLEIVNFTSAGANGNVTVGVIDEGNLPGKLDGRVYDGLTDVRVVDGSAFLGKLNLGITLTGESVPRYLDGATEPVQFSYTGSAQNDLFNIVAGPAVLNDVDFRGSVDLGAGDDRLVLDTNGGWLKNLSVNGGTGNNTLVVSNTNVGTNANFTFASFENFQNYEIEGNGATTHDFSKLPGVTNFVVATGNTDTTLRNLPAELSTVTISGKNQTVDAYGNRNNADQNFGTIAVQAAAAAALTVKLDNTARADGELYVNELAITDNGTALSAVRTLTVESNGDRDTVNAIGSINAEKVGTFNFTGTQALAVGIDAAAFSTGPTASITSLVVDGTALENTLDLAIDSAIVNAVDGANKTVTLRAGEATDDTLTFEGGVNTTARTTVSGFETVVFEAGGQFNAVNTTGVQLYVSESGDALKLTNLQSVESVELGWRDDAATGGNTGGAQVFQTNAVSPDSTLNLKALWAAGAAQEVSTYGFTTVNLNLNTLATQSAADSTFVLDLSKVAVDANGNPVVPSSGYAGAAAGLPVDDFTRAALTNIVVTGGSSVPAVGAAPKDSLDLQLVSPTVKLLDVSAYKGFVTAELQDPLTSTIDGVTYTTGNTVVKVGAFGFDITDTGHGVDTVTTFQFTADAALDASTNADYVWTIDGGIGINGGGTVGNLTVLDLSALGINSLADIIVTDVGGNANITSNGTHKFLIELVGVASADLGIENFKFAV